MNDIGQIEFYDEIEDEIGSRPSREFLKQLFIGFSTVNRKIQMIMNTYINIIDDLKLSNAKEQIQKQPKLLSDKIK